MKLLIVDDSTIVRRTIQRQISTDLIKEVFQAGNGREAVELFRQHRPDFVTMDITMPEMDGLSCVSEIMSINPKTRILVISALGDEETAIEAVERGADGYICKPFTAEELNRAFLQLVRR